GKAFLSRWGLLFLTTSRIIQASALALKGSGPLPGIAPDNFGDADQRQDRAVDGPVKVADHEADSAGQVQALEDPDGPHADHRNADQAADNPHYYIECAPHAFSSLLSPASSNSIRLWRTERIMIPCKRRKQLGDDDGGYPFSGTQGVWEGSANLRPRPT